MDRSIRALATLVVALALSPAALAQAVTWSRTLQPPGQAAHFGDGQYVLKSMALDAAGNVAVTGTTVTPSGRTDIYTARLAGATGATLWAQTWNGPAGLDDAGTAAAMDAAGNVFAVGHAFDALDRSDVKVIKYAAATGVILWQQTIDVGPNDRAYGVAVDAGGNAVLAMETRADTGSNDVRIVKLAAATGAQAWARALDFGYDDFFSDMAIDSGGNVVVAVSAGSDVGRDMRTLKLAASTGAIAWQQVANDGGDDEPIALALDGAGNVIVTGYASTPSAPSNLYAKTIKYSGAGALAWQRTIDGAGLDYGQSVAVDASGNVLLAVLSENTSGNYDMRTLKLAAATGATLWDKPLASTGADNVYSVAADAAGNAIVAAGTLGTTTLDWRVMSYGAADGALLWQRVHSGSGNGDDQAFMVAAIPGAIYVGGVSVESGAPEAVRIEKLVGPGAFAPTEPPPPPPADTTPVNLALATQGAKVSASSTWNQNFPASALIDGDVAGRNYGAGGTWGDATGSRFPDWVQVDLAAPALVDRVVVYTLQDKYTAPVEPTDTMTCSLLCATGYRVDAWDGAKWAVLATVSGNNLVKRTIDFTATTTARIRVYVTSARSSYSRLAEVEVWGGGATAPQPPPPSGTLATPSVAMAASPNPSVSGQAVALTATVSGSAGAPTGSVAFLDGATAIAGCQAVAVSGGAAACNASALSIGTHSIAARYGGDAGYAPATSAAVAVTVQAPPSTGELTNVALESAGATASASSTWNANYPARAVINGDRSGRVYGAGGTWGDSTGSRFPDWVEIALPAPRAIERVVVYSVQDRYTAPVEPTDTLTFSTMGVTAFSVQGWDGARWVALGSVAGNNLVKRTVTFPSFVTSRLRVTITASRSAYSRLAEIEAWGR